jgi:hypothetical protein
MVSRVIQPPPPTTSTGSWSARAMARGTTGCPVDF